MSTSGLVPLGIAVGVLTIVTVVVGGPLRHNRDVFIATGRAVAQILVIGLVIRLIFKTPVLAPAYLTVMVIVASYTAGRRLNEVRGCYLIALVAIATGVLGTTLIVFASGALSFNARTVVPFCAQVVGGTMSAVSVAGQRLIDTAAAQWDQIEGWLAIGATPRQAVRDLGRVSASRALVPAIDQTRNVGIVTLPGAYVGLLLAGATPLQAGKLQLLVLIGLLTAETIAVRIGTALLGPPLGKQRVLYNP